MTLKLPLVSLAVASLFAALPASAAQAQTAGALTGAEVRAQIAGHSVANADGSMTWYYRPDGQYAADDGRMARNGTYTVAPDGRLCWRDNTGAGCFQYVRQGKTLILKRVDPGHEFELGPVKVGPL